MIPPKGRDLVGVKITTNKVNNVLTVRGLARRCQIEYTTNAFSMPAVLLVRLFSSCAGEIAESRTVVHKHPGVYNFGVLVIPGADTRQALIQELFLVF